MRSTGKLGTAREHRDRTENCAKRLSATAGAVHAGRPFAYLYLVYLKRLTDALTFRGRSPCVTKRSAHPRVPRVKNPYWQSYAARPLIIHKSSFIIKIAPFLER